MKLFSVKKHSGMLLFCMLAITSCFMGCKSDEDDTQKDKPNSQSTEANIAELYLRVEGYLFSNGTIDTDVERMMELERRIVQKESNESDVTLRGVVSGTVAIAKFVNTIQSSWKSNVVTTIAVIEKVGMSPQDVFDNLSKRNDGSHYGYTDANEFYKALKEGKLDQYSGNIYNDLYNSGTDFSYEAEAHPMSIAATIAPQLADCAKDVVLSIYPNDLLSWGQVPNDLVNQIADVMKNRDTRDVADLAKTIITTTTAWMQLEEQQLDQDVINEITTASIDKVKEYINECNEADKSLFQEMVEEFAEWCEPEYEDPSGDWAKYLMYKTWYYYNPSDNELYWTFFFGEDGSGVMSSYYEAGLQDWGESTDFTYSVSGDHMTLSYTGHWEMMGEDRPMDVTFSGTLTKAESGSQKRVTFTSSNGMIIYLRNTEIEGWQPSEE